MDPASSEWLHTTVPNVGLFPSRGLVSRLVGTLICRSGKTKLEPGRDAKGRCLTVTIALCMSNRTSYIEDKLEGQASDPEMQSNKQRNKTAVGFYVSSMLCY